MKRKTGLQKKISSIFSGVAVPKSSEEESTSSEVTPPSAPAPPSVESSSTVAATPPVESPLSVEAPPLVESPSSVEAPLSVESPPSVEAPPSVESPPKVEAPLAEESSPTTKAQNPFASNAPPATPASEAPPEAPRQDPLISSSLGTKVDLSRPIVDLPDILEEDKPATKKAMAQPVIYEPKLKGETTSSTNEGDETGADEDSASPSTLPQSQSSSLGLGNLGTPTNPTGPDPTKPSAKPAPAAIAAVDPLEEAILQRQRKMRTMVGILAVVFAVVIIWAVKPNIFQSTPDEATPSDDGAVLTTQAAIPRGIQWTLPEPYPSDLRDPMVRIVEEPIELPDPEPVADPEPEIVVDEPPELPVKGIVYSEDRPSVIIGTGVYFVGDVVEGVTIVAIGRDEVEFKKDEKRWSTKLH